MSAILIDTGPLVAIADESEGNAHRHCVRLFQTLGMNFITTLPCLTETMYFLGESMGWPMQERIWKLLANDSVKIYDLEESSLARMSELMEKFSDTPMDFADASLVVAAENLNTNKIFTLDSDFTVYRMKNRSSFEIIP